MGRPLSTRLCDIEGCGRRHYSLGLCEAHYKRQRLGIPLEGPIRPKRAESAPVAVCEAPNCLLAPSSGGYCTLHAQRLRRGLALDAPPRNGRFLARRHAAELFRRGFTPAEIGACFGIDPNQVAIYVVADRAERAWQ